MTEILTESFCERCGTRYTFESAAPRKSRLTRVRVLSKGVRNFVMSDDASLSEAMAEARSEEELAATTSQLDAFHQTFNFCLTCRQYTCSDCWNGPEGRCLTCAPIPGQEEPVALVDLMPAVAPATANGIQHSPVEDDGAWPAADLPADRLARVLDGPEDAAADEAGATDVIGAAGEDQPVPDTEAMVSGLAPGQSLDDAIAAYEQLLATEEAETAASLAVPAARSQPEPVAEESEQPVAPEPEPIATEPVAEQPDRAAPEPEPIATEPPSEPVAADAEPVAAAPEMAAAEPARPARDEIPQPTWPVPTPDASVAPAVPEAPGPSQAPAASPWLTVAPDDAPPPAWPATPQWPSPQRPAASSAQDMPTTLAGRPLLQSDATALWAASAQEVLGAAPLGVATPVAAPTPSAQPCISCGLSLSANARFCRRCGSRQG